MKVVIVDENCDTKLEQTIILLEFIAQNRQCLSTLDIELVKISAKNGGPKDHILVAGNNVIQGIPAIMQFLRSYIGEPTPIQTQAHKHHQGHSQKGANSSSDSDLIVYPQQDNGQINDYWLQSLGTGDETKPEKGPSVQTSQAFQGSDALKALASKTQPAQATKKIADRGVSSQPIAQVSQRVAYTEPETIDIQAQMANRFRMDGGD